MSRRLSTPAVLVAAVLVMPVAAKGAMYRCISPDNGEEIVTNLLSDADARQRECVPLQARRSTLDSAPAAHGQAHPPASARATAPTARRAPTAPALVSPAEVEARKVPPKIQRVRDDDRRTILETELRHLQEALARDRQRGQAVGGDDTERRRWEQEMARRLADVDAVKRELSRLP